MEMVDPEKAKEIIDEVARRRSLPPWNIHKFDKLVRFFVFFIQGRAQALG